MDGCFLRAAQQILIGRVVEFDANIGLRSRETIKGVPQGGKASREPWIIGMNDMLRNLGKCAVAYADDLGLALSAHTKQDLKKGIDNALNVIGVWYESTGLIINSPK